MLLQELLNLNKIVFGVDNPKIRPFYNYTASIIPQSSVYLSGLYFDNNFTNRFIYAGEGIFKFRFLGRRLVSGVYNYVLLDVISVSYVCYYDVLKVAKNNNYDLDGLSFITAIPITYIPQSYNVNLKGTNDDFSGEFYTLSELGYGGIRVYLIEYDYSKLLVF